MVVDNCGAQLRSCGGCIVRWLGSTGQAEQTRATVIAAATRLFIEQGWNGTGMREVAKAARVSIETVYANFGSKAELLKQAIDNAVAGALGGQDWMVMVNCWVACWPR